MLQRHIGGQVLLQKVISKSFFVRFLWLLLLVVKLFGSLVVQLVILERFCVLKFSISGPQKTFIQL